MLFLTINLSPALCSFLDFKLKRFRLAVFLTVEAGQLLKAKITLEKESYLERT